MITYEQAKNLPVIARLSRPDGYNGHRCEVDLILCGEAVYEVAQCGVYRCPVFCFASNTDEVSEEIDNHPNFQNHERV